MNKPWLLLDMKRILGALSIVLSTMTKFGNLL